MDRHIDAIVIHCSDTPAHMDIGLETIRKWHVDENGWSDVGYHYIIRRDGSSERGRAEERPGAHVRGHNQNTIGICMVGGKPDANFTAAQWSRLRKIVAHLKSSYADAAVKGHRDYDRSKTCPCFDVEAWWSRRPQ